MKQGIVIKVDHFYSHQGQSNWGQGRRFVSKEYRAYQKDLIEQLDTITPIPKDTPLRIDLTFYIKGGVDREQYAVIQEHNDYTVKVCDSLDEAIQEIADRNKDDDFYRIEHRPMEVKYGVVGDRDNISKPVYDAMEKAGIFENDNIICDGHITKFYGSPNNELHVTFEPLDPKEVVVNE